MNSITLAASTSTAFSDRDGLSSSANSTGEVFSIALNESPAPWLSDCIDNITQLCQLKNNWDSYGASPVDLYSIAFAKQLIISLSNVAGIRCPRIAASPAGFVAFSWEWEDYSRELDLEVLPDGRLRYSYIDESQEDQDCEGETAYPEMIAHCLTKW